MPSEALGDALTPFLRKAGLNPLKGPDPAALAAAYRERAETLKHMAASARYAYEDFERIDPAAAKKHLRPAVLEPMRRLKARLATLAPWSETAIAEAVRDVARDCDLKLGKLGQPLRVAVTGGPVSPSIDVTLRLVGQQRTLERLERAIALIEARAGQAA